EGSRGAPPPGPRPPGARGAAPALSDAACRPILGAKGRAPRGQRRSHTRSSMSLTNRIAWDDTVLPFQLDRSGLRGRVLRLDGALDHILTRHDYPAPVAAMVAEVALLAALIGPTIKLRWKDRKSTRLNSSHVKI